MALRWYTVVVDSHDTQTQARWWAEVLDWEVIFDTPDEAVIIPRGMSPEPTETLDEWLKAGQGMVFVKVPEDKSVKNRLHIDLAPHTSQDRDAEIERLVGMGAKHIDVGQTEEDTFTVLADPEGNEFCVLSSRAL
ncbi:VOC family protein [uncultured Agrococcus sp.]|uniref:VOC family protein n=1 Tax=uncultured Agrococcus sp. TaxID=382258 RepID=UPI0025EE104A|nr:VOC family protein [uncultured Agrococcus sp.]